MDFKSFLPIAKAIGVGLVKEIPGGDIAISVLNSVLPKDQQLPPTATGTQLENAYSTLPPEDRLMLETKKIELDIVKEEEWTKRHTIMSKNDNHSTRPTIALIFAWCMAIIVLSFMVILGLIVERLGVEGVKEVDNLWAFAGAVLSPFAVVVRAYFGDLRKEQHARLEHKPKGAFESIISAFKGN